MLKLGVYYPDDGGVLSAGQIEDHNSFVALVDTGASRTCISSRIVDGLGLFPFGRKKVQTASGVHVVGSYLVDVLIPFDEAAKMIHYVEVVDFVNIKNSPFDVLLGRDVTCKGKLVIDRNVSFRFEM